MSAELSGSIRPVSARYAAQIKELLTHQVREQIAEVEQASARKGVEPGKAETVNPVRDSAESTSSTSGPNRDAYRLGGPPAATQPARVDVSASPGAPAAHAAFLSGDATAPASILDLKV
jgi:hypothetical protein